MPCAWKVSGLGTVARSDLALLLRYWLNAVRDPIRAHNRLAAPTAMPAISSVERPTDEVDDDEPLGGGVEVAPEVTVATPLVPPVPVAVGTAVREPNRDCPTALIDDCRTLFAAAHSGPKSGCVFENRVG